MSRPTAHTKTPTAKAPHRVMMSMAVALLLVAPLARAVAPRTWVQSSYRDFSAGELDGVSLAGGGEIRLAPALEPLYPADPDPESPYVWGIARAADGTVYASVGNDGEVIRLQPGQPAESFLRAPGVVHALAIGPDGYLYLGVAPGAAVYRVSPGASGEIGEAWYVAAEQRYVWRLAFDGEGNLYVGTGDGGQVHVVAPDGTGRVLFDSSETHITALALDSAGNVIAGSEEGGHLYRIDASGDPFVLFDSPLRQITAVEPTERGVFVAGIGANGKTSQEGSVDSSAQTSAAAVVSSSSSSSSGAEPSAIAGAVYLVHPDGYVETLWISETASVHAMCRYRGGVLIGTSPEGRILLVESSYDPTIVHRVEAAQVTVLRSVPGSDEVLVASSNLGRIYRLGAGIPARGEFLSQVKDTETTSTWGRIRWRATTPPGTSIRLFSRTGNTESPDPTWSDWSGPYAVASGSSVESPRARFLQWKAELHSTDPGQTPALQWVESVFVQRNLRPEIDELLVHPAGVVYRPPVSVDDAMPFGQLPAAVEAELNLLQGNSASNQQSAAARAFLGRPFYVRGSRTFTWRASDRNGDELVYALDYRGAQQSVWKSAAEGLRETHFTWDTATVPDGLYVVRVSAGDRPSNPEDRALSMERSSEPFLVDNTPPRIDDLRAVTQEGRIRITGRAVDATSLIRQLELTVDGGEWRTFLPADGLADSETEGIEIETEGLAAGEYVFVIRATDAALNTGAAQVVVIVQSGRRDRR